MPRRTPSLQTPCATVRLEVRAGEEEAVLGGAARCSSSGPRPPGVPTSCGWALGEGPRRWQTGGAISPGATKGGQAISKPESGVWGALGLGGRCLPTKPAGTCVCPSGCVPLGDGHREAADTRGEQQGRAPSPQLPAHLSSLLGARPPAQSHSLCHPTQESWGQPGGWAVPRLQTGLCSPSLPLPPWTKPPICETCAVPGLTAKLSTSHCFTRLRSLVNNFP